VKSIWGIFPNKLHNTWEIVPELTFYRPVPYNKKIVKMLVFGYLRKSFDLA
tara:strand:+ start:11 stop:163 length:153 start_codon:yes stop_codon:yes gene_type:complete